MAHLTINSVGWTYLGLTIAWTLILLTAFGFLWYHRQLPQLRMRRLPLVLTAMVMLHIYWTICMIGYIIGPIAPCAAEYWLMSILLPFGIAVFQTANTQFLYIASQQQCFASASMLEDLLHNRALSSDGQNGPFWQKGMKRLKAIDRITRMVIFVGIGMAIQSILSVLIFLLSRKFHPKFGILDANLLGTDAEQRMRCSRGWEWWPSIVWQFFWAWIYAPYILWQSRNIQDTHGWRIQTILCCVVGLPCTPLWLCGLYLPEFAAVNIVFIPPNWFSISIFLIQCFTIFFPCYQIRCHHHLRTDTLAAIADWEAKNECSGCGPTSGSATQAGSITDFSYKDSNDTEKVLRPTSVDTDLMSFRKPHMYTMIALELALKWNADPLQAFASQRDFSGENISFLTHLANWKKVWTKRAQLPPPEKRQDSTPPKEVSDEETSDEDQLREQYNRATALYAIFISNDHADFPLNLPSQTRQHLDNLFSHPANILFGDTSSKATTINSATPFDFDASLEQSTSRSLTISDMQESTRLDSRSTAVLCLDDVWYWGNIPSEFSANCFDATEQEIKYLVLTNTWPKFVNAGYAEQIRDAQGTSLGKRLSQHFYWNRHQRSSRS